MVNKTIGKNPKNSEQKCRKTPNEIAEKLRTERRKTMKRIAKFEKVSYEQFKKDWQKNFSSSDEETKSIYESIKLPKRATSGSAGYDFYAPTKITLKPKESILIPTGIRARMDEDYVLMIYPRSGLGFKFRLQLNNTVGVIDSDYYNADNEGHIQCRLTNDTNEEKTVEIEEGQGMVQGIFMMYGITEDDEADGIRTGGFGSTTK